MITVLWCLFTCTNPLHSCTGMWHPHVFQPASVCVRMALTLLPLKAYTYTCIEPNLNFGRIWKFSLNNLMRYRTSFKELSDWELIFHAFTNSFVFHVRVNVIWRALMLVHVSPKYKNRVSVQRVNYCKLNRISTRTNTHPHATFSSSAHPAVYTVPYRNCVQSSKFIALPNLGIAVYVVQNKK